MNISINFLPVERREEIKNLKYIGVVLRIGIMALLSVVVFIVFLKFNIHAIEIEKSFTESEIVRFESSLDYRQTKVAKDSLREYSKTAKTIKSGLKSKKSFSALVQEMNKMIPEGIILSRFSIDSKEVILNGVALEREQLLKLEKQLKESEYFKSVDSPISNFVSDTNAKFIFKMDLK